MAFKTLSPRDIVDEAVAGRLDIPEFQPGFVWQPEKVKNLLDSLCRRYPVGSILCWRSPDYQAARQASGATTDRLWIVDGQQRITALCLLMGKKPYWFPTPQPWEDLYRKCDVKVNLKSSPDDVELSLTNPVIDKLPNWISARSIFNLNEERDVPVLAAQLLTQTGELVIATQALSRVMSILTGVFSAFRRLVQPAVRRIHRTARHLVCRFHERIRQ